MKKYQCPKCGKSSFAGKIDNYMEKLAISGDILFSLGYSIKDDSYNSNFKYYCPYCNTTLFKREFKIIEINKHNKNT